MTDFVCNNDVVLGSLIVLCLAMVLYITYLQAFRRHTLHLLQGVADGHASVTRDESGLVQVKINKREG